MADLLADITQTAKRLDFGVRTATMLASLPPERQVVAAASVALTPGLLVAAGLLFMFGDRKGAAITGISALVTGGAGVAVVGPQMLDVWFGRR